MNDIHTEILVSEPALAYARLPYRIELIPDESGGEPCVVARHPEFAGCMAFGATPEEAINELNEVRAEFIQVLLDAGAPIPLPLPHVLVSSSTQGMSSISIHFLGPNASALREPAAARNDLFPSRRVLRPFSYQEGSGVLCGA